jgi:hypothetical protein
MFTSSCRYSNVVQPESEERSREIIGLQALKELETIEALEAIIDATLQAGEQLDAIDE